MAENGSGRRWRRWRVGIVGALVLALAAAAAVVVVSRGGDRPAGVVAEAAAGFAEWRGVELEGTVVDERGDSTAVSLTVAADGVARGTLTRDFGASAEFVSDGTRTLLRGNAQWWLWSYPGAAADVADTWVENPPADATGLVPLESLTPRALAGILQEPGGTWARTGERTVAGQRGADYYDGDRLAVIAADGPPRLLALDVPFPAPPQVVPRAFVSEDEPPEEPDLGRLVPSAHFQIKEPPADVRETLLDAIGLIIEDIGGQATQLPPHARDLLGESGEYGAHVLTVLDLLTDPPNRAPEDRLTPAEALEIVEVLTDNHEFATLHQLVISDRLVTLKSLLNFARTLSRQRPFPYARTPFKRHLQEAGRQSMPREGDGQAPRVVLDEDYTVGEETYKADLLLLFDPAVGPSKTQQVKTIGAGHERNVIDHLDYAAGQVNGETGENPLPGSVHVVQAIFERDAPRQLGMLDRAGLQRVLTEMGVYHRFRFDEDGNPRRVDRVVITNQAGLPADSGFAREHVFDVEDFNPGAGPTPGPETGPNPSLRPRPRLRRRRPTACSPKLARTVPRDRSSTPRPG